MLQGGDVAHLLRPGGFAGPLSVLLLYMGLNGFLSWWVSRGVSKPLSTLQESALRMGEGDLTRAVSVQGDKEIADLSQALEKMRVQLQSSLALQEAHLQARKELISHVSHDLRTPLSIIRGYAEGLRDQVPQSPEAYDRYIQVILDRSYDLEALIQQLLDFSSLDAWKKSVPLEPKNPGEILQEQEVNLRANYPGIEVHITGVQSLSPDLNILVHQPSLTRILANLTENSLHHSGANPVSLTWELGQSTSSVYLKVSDNGSSLDPEDLGHIFKPLFRGDKARGRGGSGLGLSIVAGLMEAQGGTARAALSPRGGLEIILEFKGEQDP